MMMTVSNTSAVDIISVKQYNNNNSNTNNNNKGANDNDSFQQRQQ